MSFAASYLQINTKILSPTQTHAWMIVPLTHRHTHTHTQMVHITLTKNTYTITWNQLMPDIIVRIYIDKYERQTCKNFHTHTQRTGVFVYEFIWTNITLLYLNIYTCIEIYTHILCVLTQNTPTQWMEFIIGKIKNTRHKINTLVKISYISYINSIENNRS